MQQISAFNLSTTLPNGMAQAIVNALRIQITRDFAPAWGIPADLRFHPSGMGPGWPFIFFDDADQANALGYHDLTPTGFPIGKVFVRTSLNAGAPPSGVASHEMLEILVDPYIDLVSIDYNSSRAYALEVCDPVEGDLYLINGVPVSNFVYPEWFENFAQNAAGISGTPKWDHLGKLTGPFQLTPGGYASTLALSSTAWTQVTADLRGPGHADLGPALSGTEQRRGQRGRTR